MPGCLCLLAPLPSSLTLPHSICLPAYCPVLPCLRLPGAARLLLSAALWPWLLACLCSVVVLLSFPVSCCPSPLPVCNTPCLVASSPACHPTFSSSPPPSLMLMLLMMMMMLLLFYFIIFFLALSHVDCVILFCVHHCKLPFPPPSSFHTHTHTHTHTHLSWPHHTRRSQPLAATKDRTNVTKPRKSRKKTLSKRKTKKHPLKIAETTICVY